MTEPNQPTIDETHDRLPADAPWRQQERRDDHRLPDRSVQFVRFLAETNCTIAAPADVTPGRYHGVPVAPGRTRHQRHHPGPEARGHPGVFPLSRR